ncbi:TIGR03619 family F420-dependent LLM class oxidoreductase [Streptomyces sp. NPDC051572]|uniref:TIGR03619 family F420-dependent LLM class oxidoreductase n=1 Tax=unclassified Streptomyces TaxID=2593676 RepID=UPI00344B08B3
MEHGIFFPSTELDSTPEVVRTFTRAVEDMGYDYILHGDHVLGAPHDREPRMWGPYTEKDAFYDPFVLIGYMAAISTRISFATSVLILPQRQTVLVAKQAANVALLSGNRLRIGAGIGWNYVEYDALAQDFTRRGKRMDQQVTLLRRLWSEPVTIGEAGAERVDRAGLHPRPSEPVPLWLGGYADVALRRGVRVGDGFTFAGLIEEIAPRQRVLHRMLVEEGRDPAGFPTELVMIPPPGPDQGRWPRNRPNFLGAMGDTVARWRELGGTHLGVITYWMGLNGLNEHLGFAEKALAIARR